jgi:hypothetical protein
MRMGGILPAGCRRRILRAVKRLPVDLDELAALFDQSRAGPVRAFFDRASGALESMPRDAEVEGVFDDIVAEPARWVEIQPLPLPERRALRRRFVDEQMTDPHVRLRMFEALEGQRNFARFDAILREERERMDRWLRFRALTLLPLAHAWLSALGIEPIEANGLHTGR